MTEPRARLFLSRLESADESAKSFDPNGRVTDELALKVRSQLPKEVAPPPRPGVHVIDGAKMAVRGPLEKQALLSRNVAARTAAAAGISGPDVLAEVALGDADPAVRETALDRITGQATLVKLAQTTRHWTYSLEDVELEARKAIVRRLNLSRMNDPVRLERVATQRPHHGHGDLARFAQPGEARLGVGDAGIGGGFSRV